MGWPYQFLDLSHEEKVLRREALAQYGSIAHLSSFAPALIFAGFRAVVYIRARIVRARHRGQGGGRGGGGNRNAGGGADEQGTYAPVPGSPAVKAERESEWGEMMGRWRSTIWWMGDEVKFGGKTWGERGDWILGAAWMVWLLALCILDTGKDYLHLTKRLGLIATSQMPLHYLLTLKSPNPLTAIFHSSHESLNRFHRALGRIIYILLILHIILYNIFFLYKGIWWKRFFAAVVWEGVVASIGLHVLMAAAIPQVRNWSYRVFWVVHWAVGRAVPVLIFFHAPSARVFMGEMILILLVDFVARRRLTARRAASKVSTLPGTDLVKVEIPIPEHKMSSFEACPGAHVYLHIPSSERPWKNISALTNWLTSNPFTVSSVNADSRTITIIARKRAGPATTKLSTLSTSTLPESQDVPLNVTGPFGTIGKTLPSLVAGRYDRILLFAGGVGATFALPLYRAIVADSPAAKVRLVWAVRSAAEATWATVTTGSASSSSSVLDDNNVELFLTGDMGIVSSSSASEVEMRTFGSPGAVVGNKKRPDVRRIVDNTFRKGSEESIAVIVCGPKGMVDDVRNSVRPWVMQGRRVWWHKESFGY